ncbi:MspA family porin [Nocardia yamanashiensis]|uniref:MspA family porin n=1 Tax=Nocardia yamanashiensis TaxID=209247 RepID=UPI0008358E6B|nr:MspA family porin [Nocardia yamanashiensis]
MYGKGIRVRGGRVLGVALAAALAFGLGPADVARADTFVPLPGAAISRTLGDGTVMTVRITEESANISGSMGSTPMHRNVWTSARATIDLDGPTASSATIKISPGYIVGCQVDIGSFSPSENASEQATIGQSGITPGLPTETMGAGITLGPGQAKALLMLDLEKPDDYGQESHKRYNKVPGPHAGVTWVDETFAVDGCGGYAQARSFVAAEVDSTYYIGNLVLYGQPFSIG